MPNINEFRIHLVKALKLSEWTPTPTQLENIRKHFSALPPSNTTEALKIVQAYYGRTRHFIMDGLDNSDVNSALILAIAAAKT